MSSVMEKKQPFTTNYKYLLRQVFKIFYGAYSKDMADIKKGLIGDIGPFFYASSYLDHIEKYWMGSNYIGQLILSSYVRVEYIFQDYRNIKDIKDRMKKINGKISGPVFYSGKTGITMLPKSEIELEGNLVPVGTDITHSLCFFFNFHFYEPLPDDFLLFKRGTPGKKDSVIILLKKASTGGRYPSMTVVYDFKGKPERKVYENPQLVLKPSKMSEIELCLATGPDKINSAGFFV